MMAPRPHRHAIRMPAGLLLRAAILSAAIALLVDTWLVDGWLPARIVASGSMAPALVGPHWLASCTHCGHLTMCDREAAQSATSEITCAACGRSIDAGSLVERGGDLVLFDRSAFVWRAPRRWEVVVCQKPDEPRETCLKRVVGLPGEAVEIRDGDVFVDGQIARKSLPELRNMAVLVSSTRAGHTDGASENSRWKCDSGDAWRLDGGRFSHRAADDSTAPIDWLVFHPAQVGANPAASANETIFDESPYDPTESRALSPVRDVMLRLEVRARTQGLLILRGESDGQAFIASLDIMSGALELTHDGRSAAHAEAGLNPLSDRATLEWALVDRQVLLAINGRVLLEYRYELPGAPNQPARDISLGAQQATVEIERLDVLRDVYYTNVSSTVDGRMYRLGPDKFFLLGDNSPHSIDSRSWSPAGVRADQILGRAIPVRRR
jgi:signal peptidase I